MDERTQGRWGDWGRVLLVALLALLVRGWLITHTEVSARDSIGFIRYALQFDDRPWADVVRSFEQHPGYPVLVWLVSRPVRLIAGGTSCDAMVLSAQLATTLSAVLMVIPVYFLGKTLFGRHAGLVAAALLQCLPVFVRVTADGLSEGPFLLFLASGLYFAITGLRTRSSWRFLTCGLFTGLAYLTRPEGGELAIAAAAVLGVVGFVHWGWRRTVIGGAALALGLVPCIGLYVGITGHLTNKPTPNGILHGEPVDPPPAIAKNCTTLVAAFWDAELQSGQSRTWWGLQTLFRESVKSFHYATAALALLGVVLFRRRLRDDAGLWVLAILTVIHAVVLWRMAVVIGYVSERHTLPLVLVGVFWAGAAIPEIGRLLGSIRRFTGQSWPRFVPELLAVVVMAAGVPSIVKPLHANRAGHHAAGRWMAGHVSDQDEVVDPFCWAHFYAGCLFREGKDHLPPVRTRYVVIEQTGNPHSRLTAMPMARELAAHGEPVYHWPEKDPTDKAAIVVYRVPPCR
jgi:hypothetical protein